MIRHPRRSPLFPYTPLSRPPTGIRDGGRREPCEPQPCSLGERNVCRDLAAVGIPRHVQESPVRGSNEGALGCNADRKSTRLNSCHLVISYAVFCLKKKNQSS